MNRRGFFGALAGLVGWLAFWKRDEVPRFHGIPLEHISELDSPMVYPNRLRWAWYERRADGWMYSREVPAGEWTRVPGSNHDQDPIPECVIW